MGTVIQRKLYAGVPGYTTPSGLPGIRLPLTLSPRALPADPSLTLTGAQTFAKLGKAENRKPVAYAESANPCNAQQPPTAHS